MHVKATTTIFASSTTLKTNNFSIYIFLQSIFVSEMQSMRGRHCELHKWSGIHKILDFIPLAARINKIKFWSI
jgi:hypothetical protein